MKILSIILCIFGVLFFLMGLFVEPLVPPMLLSVLFFTTAILFWRNKRVD